MNRYFLTNLILFLILPALAAAQSNEFNYDDIVQLIGSKKLTSMEQLLPLLPASFRSSFTLMENSQSLQKDASPIDPRAILFSTSGKLSCTFVGNPKQTGFDDLECYQYNDSTNSFGFHQIEFPSPRNGRTQVAFSQLNQAVQPDNPQTKPMSCITCHNQDPRPNWEPYNKWPGAYGAEDDTCDFPSISVPATMKQSCADFLKFKAGAKKSPRYSSLIFAPGNVYSPYRPVNYYDLSTTTRPNLRLNEAIERLTAHRDTRLLSQLPRSQQYLFLMAVSNCPISSQDEMKYPQFLDTLYNYYGSDAMKASGQADGPIRTVRAAIGDKIAAAVWVPSFRALNSTCEGCLSSGTIPPQTGHAQDGAGPWTYDYEDGSYITMDTFVANDLMAQLIATGDSDLKPYYAPILNYSATKEIPNPSDVQEAQFSGAMDLDGLPLDTTKSNKACGLLAQKLLGTPKTTRSNTVVQDLPQLTNQGTE